MWEVAVGRAGESNGVKMQTAIIEHNKKRIKLYQINHIRNQKSGITRYFTFIILK